MQTQLLYVWGGLMVFCAVLAAFMVPLATVATSSTRG